MRSCRHTPSSGSITRRRASFTSILKRRTKRRFLRRNIISTGIRKAGGRQENGASILRRGRANTRRRRCHPHRRASSAKLEFFRYVHAHKPRLELKVVGIENAALQRVNRRSSGSCPEPIRPLTVRVVVPASMERTIRSIEADSDCGHTNGN